MKKYVYISVVLLLLFIQSSWAQQADSTRKEVPPIKAVADSSLATGKSDAKDSLKTTATKPDRKEFVDANADGIDDRLEKGKGKDAKPGKEKGRKDKFIDQNGDGICDGQESAFGLKKAFRQRKGRK